MTESRIPRVFRSGLLLLIALLFATWGCTYGGSQFERIACDESTPCPGDATCEAGLCVLPEVIEEEDDLQCPPNQQECSDRCIDTDFDRRHCGTCDNACNDGQICRDGQCESFCAPGTTRCDDQCINTLSDSSHCGACGSTCPDGQICRDGECADNCSLGGPDDDVYLRLCGDVCRDLLTDPDACGACDTQCSAPDNAVKLCLDGTCNFSCLPGLLNCGDRCIDPETTTCAVD